MSFKEKLRKFVIFYMPGLLAFGFNCFCYITPKFIVTPDKYIHIATPIDDLIPFCPPFLIFYCGSFLQWALYYFGENNLNSEETYRTFSGEIFAKSICFLCFIFFPVTLNRPEITGHSFWDLWMRIVYGVDTPCCLFPSFHCFASWMHLRYCWKHCSTKTTVFVFIFTIGVFASTLLIKQHLLIDVISGVAIAEFGQYVSNHTGLHLKFKALCDKIRKRIGG
ncbi:MAG: hypothetical protein IJM15_05755 [Erysipelotrichaceae bacterium]|nr:hypothetical protein [Erysipelotrichaceae bacterium]